MKRIIRALACIAALVPISVCAEVPAGYYDILEGKSGVALKEAVKKAAIPEDYTLIVYGDGNTSFKTWQAFELTDVREIKGRRVWWDMYSNKLAYVDLGHVSLNIEHSVANSWWGGKDGCVEAYSDLMHLNPSDADANGRKSNNPLGVVGPNPSYENGMIKVGPPAVGYGGGSSTVFEPADEYKGDFARAYMYIFTAYDDIPWLDNKGGEKMYTISNGKIELQPWVVEMLLKWAAEDPVDDKEMHRNEEIYNCQKNRNPFIDYPSLAEYIWGKHRGEIFTTSGKEAAAVNRPKDPDVENVTLEGVNTYVGDYWGSRDVVFSFDEGDLWISLDGGEYQRYGDRITLPAGLKHGDVHQIKAYLTKEVAPSAGEAKVITLRSSVVTVTMSVKDPLVLDYTTAIWEPVAAGSEISDDYYLLLSADNQHVMGCEFEKNGYMPDAGLATIDNAGRNVVRFPDGSAMVKFVKKENTKYLLNLFDGNGNSKGYWTTTAAKKMKLSSDTGTLASVNVEESGACTISFGESLGTLQYNKNSPRFLNYTSNMGNVVLYRFMKFADKSNSGVVAPEIRDEEVVSVSGNNIYPGEGGAVYDLNGRVVSGLNLESGIYIAVSKNGKAVKVRINK